MMTVVKDTILARATAVVDRISADYPGRLSEDLEVLEADLAAGRREQALRAAQNIAGEATCFGWPAASALGSVLRDLLEQKHSPKADEGALVIVGSMKMLLADRRPHLEGANEDLLDKLRGMVSAIADQSAR
ncbi:MAG: hypothetical protein AAGL49_06960 [Pseudomonadota bacterium]